MIKLAYIYLLLTILSIMQPMFFVKESTNTVIADEHNPQFIGKTEEGWRISFEKKIVINSSYYIKSIKIFSTGDTRYYNSFVYGYSIANIDNDTYPDIIIWTLKRIMIWSYNKGLYVTIKTNNMFDKPIPIDEDNDGIIDYIILAEHRNYDAVTQYTTRYMWTKFYKWFPINNTLKLIARVSVFAPTRTYVRIGDVLFLPSIINVYYPKYWGNFIVHVGLLSVNTKNGQTSYMDLYTARLHTSSILYRNDISTTYMAYIYRLTYDTLAIIPSGLDMIFIVKLLPEPRIVKTIQLQHPNGLKDGIMVLPSNDMHHSPGEHAWVGIYSKYFFWPLWVSDIYVSNKLIIIPYGYFYFSAPTGKASGRNPYVVDYIRTERATGVMVVDIENNAVKKIPLLGKTFGNYIIRAISSINILDQNTIYIGCMTQIKGSNKAQSIVLMIKSTDEWKNWTTKVLHSVPSEYHYTRGYPILPVNTQTYMTYSYLYHKKTIIPYHRTKVKTNGPTPFYVLDPVIFHNLSRTDIDADGIPEYITIVQYQRSSGTCWGTQTICYMPPYAYGGAAWLLIFKQPVLDIRVNGSNLVGSTVSISISVNTSKISDTRLSILYNGTTAYESSIKGSGKINVSIELDKPGNITLLVKSTTKYYVYDSIISARGRKQLVTFTIQFEIPLITVMYRSRILLLRPRYNVLTPNYYSNGLTVEALLQYYDPHREKWANTTPVNILELVIRESMALSRHVLTLDPATNTYKAVINGLKPSIINLTIGFKGYRYYSPTTITTVINLTRYPVQFYVRKSSIVPALTPFELDIDAYYSLIVNGEWITEKLSIGTIKASTDNITIYIPAGTGKITIPYNKVLPPRASINISYIPPEDMDDLYTNTTTQINISVEPLEINATPLHLKYYRDKTIRVLETYGKLVRNITANYTAILVNKTTTIILSTEEGFIRLDYSSVDPGNYTLIIKPTTYTTAYSKTIYYFNVTIDPPNLWISIEVNPLITVNNSYTTYTLVPVNITPIIVSPALRLSSSPVLHINNDEVTVDPNKTMTIVFKKPGTYNITLIVDYYGLPVNYTVHVTVLPHPVKLIINTVNGSIIIRTEDLLRRTAPGNISLAILYKSKRIYSETLPSNGNTLVNTTWLLHGRYLIEARFRGNESYAPATNKTLLELDPPIEPLPEPMIPPILLLSLLALLYRVYRKGKGK